MAAAAHHAPRSAPAAEPPSGAYAPVPRPARALLAALVVCLLLAAFAGGATDLPEESWVQIALLVVACGACSAGLYGGGVAAAGSRTAWAGIALLAAFAAWSGASIAWSVAPDRSWLELNRGLGYALAAALGLAAGTSLPRARGRVCAALAGAGAVVALYAAAAKTVPGLGFDHAAELSRLRAPLGYWNALGLVCAVAVPPALAVWLDPDRRRAWRLVALAGAAVALLVLGLTYSRGGIIALVAGTVVLLALGREQLRILAGLLLAAVAAAPALALAVSSADLTADGLPLARRQDDALVVLAALAAGLGVLVAAGRGLLALEARGAFTPRRDRLAVGLLLAALLAAGAGAAAGTAAGERGIGDAIAAAADDFTSTRGEAVTDPQRVLSRSSGNRWVWWEEAAGAWWDRPVAGWGAGSFPVTHRLYRKVELNVRQPHSMPLQWLAETGVVGLLLAAGGLLALLAAGIARVQGTPAGPERVAGAALVAAGAVWLVHSLYDWDWDIPGATLPMLVALGAAAAARREGRPATPVGTPGVRGLALALAAGGLLLAGVSAALPAVSATKTESALDEVASGPSSPERLALAASRAELAARLNPLAVEPLFATASIAQRLGDPVQARRQLRRAIERQPNSAEAWSRMLRLELAVGDTPAVLRVADRLVELDPGNRNVVGLAERARARLTPPSGSATATGSPLPQAVAPPVTPDPAAPPAPDPAPALPPAPTPAPTPPAR